MRFKEYLANRRASFTAQGRFVRFALSDPDFPDAKTLQDLNAYLQKLPAGAHRIHSIAAETVWGNYLSQRDASNVAA